MLKSLSLHRLTKVRITPIKADRKTKRGDTYSTREIELTNSRGETFVLDLFADTPEALEIDMLAEREKGNDA